MIETKGKKSMAMCYPCATKLEENELCITLIVLAQPDVDGRHALQRHLRTGALYRRLARAMVFLLASTLNESSDFLLTDFSTYFWSIVEPGSDIPWRSL